jgi:hypothetical protein
MSSTKLRSNRFQECHMSSSHLYSYHGYNWTFHRCSECRTYLLSLIFILTFYSIMFIYTYIISWSCRTNQIYRQVMFSRHLSCNAMACVMFSRHLSCNAMSCVVFSRHLSCNAMACVMFSRHLSVCLKYHICSQEKRRWILTKLFLASV